MTAQNGAGSRTKWKGRAGNGNWFDDARWSNGVPQADSRVIFDNGGTQTVRLSGRTAEAGRLAVEHDTLTLANGVLDLSAGPASPDLHVDDGGSLTVGARATVAARGEVAIGQLTRTGAVSAGTLVVQGKLVAGTVDDISGVVTVAAAATLDASGGIAVTPVADLGQISPLGTLVIAGSVIAGTLSGAGTITAVGPEASLTSTALVTAGTLTVGGGAVAALGSVALGSSEVSNLTGSLSVAGAGSAVTAGQITVSGDANGALSVADGGTLTAAAIVTTANESDAAITVTGAFSSLTAGTLTMGGIGNSDTLTITQCGAVTAGAGGLTVDLSAVQLDASATLSTPVLTSLAGTIDAVAHGGAVTLASAVALGVDGVTGRGQTSFAAGAGAALTVVGAVTGAATTSLLTTGDVTLANAGNVLPGIGIQSGTLSIAASGAAGTGTISFLGSAAATTMQIDAGVTLGNTIAGFAGSDAIDLRGFAFNANIMESLQGGTLTLDNGAAFVSLVFAGSYVADQFVLQTDMHGGTLITFHN